MDSRLKGNKITIQFNLGKVDTSLIELLSFSETAKKSKATKKNIQNLADEITSGWWEKNKHKFINEISRW